MTYLEPTAEVELRLLPWQEKDALSGIFDSFQNNVKAPITAFANMTEQARQVFEQDVSSLAMPQTKTLRDKTDRSLALEDGK